MIKKCVFIALTAAAFLFSSCERENFNASSKEGILKVQLDSNSDILNLPTRSAIDNIPSVNDFKLKIYQGENVFMSWDRFADLKESMVIATGNYLAIAEYGDVANEGFEVEPAFYGEKAFTISEGKVTEVKITSSLQNALVNIFYSDSFKDYFTSYSTKIISTLDNVIEFVEGETRTAFLKPGNIELMLNLKAPGAENAINMSAGTVEILAKKIYNITLDANASTATLTISFADDVDKIYDIEIDLSDIDLNSTAPAQIAVGYQSGVQLEAIESVGVGKVQTQIYSATGLQSCFLTTTSTSLLSKGWPAEVDLVNASTEILDLMKGLGLKLVNFATNDGVVFVDFTNVIPNLRYDESDAMSSFSVVSVDKFSKPAIEPSVLLINSVQAQLAFTLPENIVYGATGVESTVNFNGDIDEVTYQCLIDGIWQTATPLSIAKNGDNYSVVLSFPLAAYDTVNGMQVKAIFNKQEEIATSNIDAPILLAEVSNPGDVWATSSTFAISNAAPSTLAINNNDVVMEYKSGDEWVKPVQTVAGSSNTVTGLNAGAEYTFRARLVDSSPSYYSHVSAILNITTEDATQVPNADMNDWNVEATRNLWKTINIFTSKITFTSYKPNSDKWATTNVKTFNQGSNNAINAYPSVVYETVSTGDNAAVIRSIGWTKGIGNDYTIFAYHRSAGKMFLGSYSFDGDSKIDTYNYGIEFTSRPLSISFDYKYDSYNSDKFKVWAVVENRDGGVVKRLAYGEIAAGEAAASYRNTSISLNYDPSYTNLKATHFYLVFSSSNLCDDVHATESGLLWDPTKMLRIIDGSYWGGSVLYVDDIKLNY